jgi:predicted kinase
MTRLVVVAGLANSGKMPLAKRLMDEDPSLVLVHRDTLRTSLEGLDDEPLLSLLMVELADALLAVGRSVINCAWTTEPEDRHRWQDVAKRRHVDLEWLDTRKPEVAKLIPPLEGWTPDALKEA